MAETIVGLKMVSGNLDKIKKDKNAQIMDAIEYTQAVIINQARKTVPVYLGDLQRSIQAGPISIQLTAIKASVVAESEHASYVEFKVRPHFPPLGPIKEWAHKKLGDESAAFPVARQIAKKGFKTLPKPFLGPAVMANRTRFRNAIIKAMQS